MNIPKLNWNNLITLKNHLHHRTLHPLQHLDLANGNLEIIGLDSISGQKTDSELLKEGYDKNAQAYSIIRKISETGSDIPWVPHLIKPDGSLERITKGRFFDFVQMPNEDQTIKEFKMDSYGYFLTTGDLFWHKPDVIGFAPTELTVKESQLMEVLKNQGDPLVPTGYKFELGMQKEAFTLEEIIHQKYFNPTTRGILSLRGLSPLSAAWLTLSADNQRSLAQESMQRNRGAIGFISNESDTIMGDNDRDVQQSLLDRILGGAWNTNKVIVAKSKAKFNQIGMSSSDLEILKTGIQNLRTLCNVYGAPSELFNDPANKTFNNQKTALKSFYENAVLPVDRRFLAKFNEDVVKDWSKADKKNYVVTQDLDHVGALQEDQDLKAARADKIINGITKIVQSVNQQQLTPEAAAAIIAHAHGISIEDAQKFVVLSRNQNPNED